MKLLVNLGEPPDADPHVRWCERTGASRPLLLDFVATALRPSSTAVPGPSRRAAPRAASGAGTATRVGRTRPVAALGAGAVVAGAGLSPSPGPGPTARRAVVAAGSGAQVALVVAVTLAVAGVPARKRGFLAGIL